MRTKENLTKLGSGHTEYRTEYDPSLLEAFDNLHPENDYFVKANCPEFTSLCPITGQPDYANIVISYVPDKKIVESKSLKRTSRSGDGSCRGAGSRWTRTATTGSPAPGGRRPRGSGSPGTI